MPRSTFSRAAAAAALLASTASAAYSAGSSSNVAMYWGQGYDQLLLSEVCADPTIDVVNIAFVNGFPAKVGDYPATNFANACWDYYEHPTDKTQNGKLLKTCPTVGPAIKACQANGKKVLLSLGGGAPTNYYLPSQPVAKYFAEFLVGAFGPASDKWTGPRPFGDAHVDGFDLDLEAEVGQVPTEKDIYANYAYFVNQLKAIQSSLLISSAPQCIVPDPRLADAIKNAPFDMIFTQFYNTDLCSAKLGYQQINQASTGFSFNKWVEWLNANSFNKNVKLYLGLAAGTDGLPTHKDHYLQPNEANALITKWRAQYPNNFGGVMLWEATVSARNVVNCQSYSFWMKAALDGTFLNKYKACTSSSSISPSSTKASSTKASSTKASSTKASSTVASTTSAAITPTATIQTPNGLCGDQKNGVAYSCIGYNFGNCCSEYGFCGGDPSAPGSREAYCGKGCNPLFGECDGISTSARSSTKSASASSSIKPSSASATPTKSASSSSIRPSSSAPASSSVRVSSSAPASSSIRTSSSAPASSSVHTSSSAPASSSVHVSSSVASSSAHVSSSASVHVSSTPSAHVSSSVVTSSASTPAASSSASHSAASSSVHDSSSSSAPHSSAGVTYTPYPTGTPSAVYSSFPGTGYPVSSSSSASAPHYGNFSAPVSYTIPSYDASTSVPVYDDAKSTPCTTSSIKGASSTPSYVVYKPSSTPGYPVYEAPSSSTPGYPVYEAPSSSGKGYDSYPASSTPKGYGNEYPPSVTSKPGNDYPVYPASSPTTKIITTTYVDSCETGVTTKTETITQTVCNKCKDDSITSVYVCNKCGPTVVTYTITKPNTPATNVPSVPTAPAKPYEPVKPQEPSKPSNPPTYGNDVPKKQEVPATSTTVAIVYITKTPIPVVPSVKYTPIPYPSGPAKNGTSGYPVKPTGTGGAPTKPTSYSPPQFTGAASHVGAGMGSILAIVAGLLVL